MKKTLLTLTVLLLALTACDSEKARLDEYRSARIAVTIENRECDKTLSKKERYSLDNKCSLIYREKMDQLEKEYYEKYGEWPIDTRMRNLDFDW